jgi:predicted transposase YdaD
MTRDRKDRSANWIIERHGDSLLRLAKVSGFTSWRPAQTVLSFPKQMPDGLLDVSFPGRPAPDPFLIEIESYPAAETSTQIRDDAAMTILTRGVLPNILLVVLFPKGNATTDPEHVMHSSHGMSELRLKITVINMWMIPAEELIAANDVGIIPFVPLTAYSGPPEALLQRCAERIEQQAPQEEKGNLLATTHVMAEMRYNNADLLKLLGGQAMTMQKVFDASPTIQRIKAETAREIARKYIVHRLEKRFAVPEDLAAHLRTIENQVELDRLLDLAFECDNLDVFRGAVAESFARTGA